MTENFTFREEVISRYDTETYNLDRKQFVLASLADYHDAIHGAERRFAG